MVTIVYESFGIFLKCSDMMWDFTPKAYRRSAYLVGKSNLFNKKKRRCRGQQKSPSFLFSPKILRAHLLFIPIFVGVNRKSVHEILVENCFIMLFFLSYIYYGSFLLRTARAWLTFFALEQHLQQRRKDWSRAVLFRNNSVAGWDEEMNTYTIETAAYGRTVCIVSCSPVNKCNLMKPSGDWGSGFENGPTERAENTGRVVVYDPERYTEGCISWHR